MWKVFQLVIIGAIVWAWQTYLGMPDSRLLILAIVAFAVCMALLATNGVRAGLDLLPHRRQKFAEPAENPAARLPEL
jgi:hypothetical protein